MLHGIACFAKVLILYLGYVPPLPRIISPHRSSSWIWPIATDGVTWSVVGLCVCLLLMTVSPTTTAEPIKMQFGGQTSVGS